MPCRAAFNGGFTRLERQLKHRARRRRASPARA